MRNTYAICPQQEDSSPKGELTLHKIVRRHRRAIKTPVVEDEHADDYREALTKLRDSVQMEIRIAWATADHDTSVHAATGTDYLRLKQQRHARLTTLAESLRSAVNLSMIDWRERDSSDGSRLFALFS